MNLILPAKGILPVPFSEEHKKQIAMALSMGTPLAFPTETYYALGGNALQPDLTREILRIKNRPREKALLLLVNGRHHLKQLVDEIPPEGEMLIDAFWPGPLTLVFKAAKDIPPHLPDERWTIAVRHSPHPVISELFNLTSAPLFGTSANVGGKPPACTAEEVAMAFYAEKLGIIDGGITPGKTSSTILDLSEKPNRLLREGSISFKKLRKIIPDLKK